MLNSWLVSHKIHLTIMSKRCALTGKGPMVGNNVSHANNKTKRRFLPNLQAVSFLSETLGTSVQLRVCTQAVRSVEFHGGLDAYLLRTPVSTLNSKAAALKKLISRKKEEQK